MVRAVRIGYYVVGAVIMLTVLTSATTLTDSLLRELDEVICNRDAYLAEKQSRLRGLWDELDATADRNEQFNILVHLFDEYHSYNTDSAYQICLCQEELARQIGEPNVRIHARLGKADIMSATGMYHEALEILKSLNPAEIPGYLKAYYYHINRTVYGRLADYAAFDSERERYNRIVDIYRDSIMAINEPGSLGHVITKADYHNVHGSPEEAVRILEEFMQNNDMTEHDHAICAWTLSDSYARLGDKEKQKELVLQSSISDLKSSVREYVSLRQLALLLYEEGDLDRAYRYITIAVDDAAKCNARQRILELNESYPKINEIYVNAVQSRKRALEWTILIITLLSLALLVSLYYTRKQMKRVARARREIQEAYDRLNEVTLQLKASNAKLSEANEAIAENSELKEVYIGRYMDQCLVYIEKLDAYRKSIGKLVNSGKSDDLKKLVKSSSEIDEELKQFYDQFDKTFLSLFPTFVEEFNRLLLPGEAIIPRKEGSLNPELRIFALIRLGITDSDRIARFLRYSLTTIYNYRTKVRNKAAGDRNKLEAEVLLIGKSTARNTLNPA